MPRRLAALVGAVLAVLLVLHLVGREGDPAGRPPRVEVVPSTHSSPPEHPAELEAIQERVSLPVENAPARIAFQPHEPPPPPASVSAPDDLHWIEGRAMLEDGTPITGFHVAAIASPDPDLSDEDLSLFTFMATRRDAHVTCRLNELGRFRLGPLPGGPYGVALRTHRGAPGDWTAQVEAPTTTAELRVDGKIAVLELPRNALARPGWSDVGSCLEIHSTRGPCSVKSGSAIFDEEGRSEHLLRSDAGYHFKSTFADGSIFEGALDEDTPPGRHHVQLEVNLQEPGTLRAVLRGDARDDEGRILITVFPLSPRPERPGGLPTSLRMRFRGDLSAARDVSVGPGRYSTSARVLGEEKTSWAAVAHPAVIDVQPGQLTEIEVELIEGGGLSVLTEGTVAVEPSTLRLEHHDAERDEWVGLLVRTAQGGQASTQPGATVLPGGTNQVPRVFPPGPLRVRLRGDGWRTVEATLTIVSGQTTTWRPRLELE
ncbi:MAG: hypothetical protein AAGB93_03520 [Planctomycetota bacterium]